MKYISTRGNHIPVESSQAINIGMVPDGGLFVPEFMPRLPQISPDNSYQETARIILESFLTDYSEKEIDDCISSAYNDKSFDTKSIIDITEIDKKRFLMELWHGPTAAFKDMALQIMPHFLSFAKKKINNKFHTVILVATSGDTGKAALEGFKNCDGISVMVFYPDGGVSEIQRLQMDTTDGSNTAVVSVKGNFDDCQTGVRNIFSDIGFRKELESKGFEFSSANSINWGRLCPQIIYYYQSYNMLVKKGSISYGDPVDFCVPTGNFGNILAGYYAKMTGLPIRKLFCASNKNNVLTDFFMNGTYDRNRDFHKTVSPSMDILISSNLERFLFEISGHDAKQVKSWYDLLNKNGSFRVSPSIKRLMDDLICAGWVDEQKVLDTIADVYHSRKIVIDTHTAVAVAVGKELGDPGIPMIIASTASPYKFSCDVLKGIKGDSVNSEFEAIKEIALLSGTAVHRAVDNLQEREIRHNKVIDIKSMKISVQDFIRSIRGKQ
jgi:threonine synthase